MKKKLPVLIAITAVAAAVLYLITTGFEDTGVYYKTVDELLAEPQRFETRPVRINGILVEGSLLSKPGTDEFRFEISKRNEILTVIYKGVLPDTLKEGRELVVQGVYDSRSKTFTAREILTKCPSKYEAEARAAD